MTICFLIALVPLVWILLNGYLAAPPTMINNERTKALQPALDRMWAGALTLIVLVPNISGRVIAGSNAVQK